MTRTILLLRNKDYVEKVNTLIQDTVSQYALLVYSPEFINNSSNYNHIYFTIDYDLFLETLLLKIRGETIKFSSQIKKERSILEEKLIEDIKDLENSSYPFSVNLNNEIEE